MHELERRALDDPLLADALEGFGHAPADQAANLAELTGRLHQRTEKNRGRVIRWIPLSAAASILLVLGAGIWFFTNRWDDEKAKPALAQSIVAEKNVQPVVSAPGSSAGGLQKQKSNPYAQASPRVLKTNHRATEIQVDSSSTPLREQAAVARAKSAAEVAAAADYKSPIAAEPSSGYDKSSGYFMPKKDSVAANEMLVGDMQKKKNANSAAAFKPKTPQSTQTLVQSRVEGVSVNPDDGRTVSGTVIGSGDIPITGATVKVDGRNFGAVTDANGKFVLPDVAKSQTLSVNYIGYSGKKVKADKDSMRISLEPANSSLAEVVMANTQQETAVRSEDAHPGEGWNAFDDYLKKNAQSPDGKTGKVKADIYCSSGRRPEPV